MISKGPEEGARECVSLRRKDRIGRPLFVHKSSERRWLFLGPRIAVRQTQRKAFLFPMGQGSIYGPPSRKKGESRGFSGIAVWQTADVPYTRGLLSPFLPPPFSLSFVPCASRFLSLQPPPFLFYGLIVPRCPATGVFTISPSIVERPNDTRRYVSYFL